jgi:hypothetical protein
MRLHVRLLSGRDVAAERLFEISSAGVEVPLEQGYTAFSASLFDAATGQLLAREYAPVLAGRVSLREGATESQAVVDSRGVSQSVTWVVHDRASAAIDPAEPWADRARLSEVRGRVLAESRTVRLYGPGDRPAILAELRDTLRDQDNGFVRIWDPYFDASVAKDLLQWLHPRLSCHILCGQITRNPPTQEVLKELKIELAKIRAKRNVPLEAKYKVKKVQTVEKMIYHDRFLITATRAWFLGASLNQIGNKPGAIVRLLDADRIRWMFEDEWNRKGNDIKQEHL